MDNSRKNFSRYLKGTVVFPEMVFLDEAARTCF